MKSMKKWLLMLTTALSVVAFAVGCSSDTEEDTGTEEYMEEESNLTLKKVAPKNNNKEQSVYYGLAVYFYSKILFI